MFLKDPWFSEDVKYITYRNVAIILGLIEVLLIFWWGEYMKSRGAAIDAYPSRWINSAPFILTVLIGSMSGTLTLTSFIPWGNIRFGVFIALMVLVPFLFFVSLGTSAWFEMNYYGPPAVSEALFITVVHYGVLMVIIGWMLSLLICAKRIIFFIVVLCKKWFSQSRK